MASTPGFLARLSGGLKRARTLTAGANISISNPTGDAGDPTIAVTGIGSSIQAWDADLDAIAALATTGLIVRTGAGTVTTRDITAGSGIVVTNGGGVAGNPVIAFISDFNSGDTSTGTVNDWDTSIGSYGTVLWDGASDVTFTGIANGSVGYVLTVKNITASKVAYFAHQSGSSSAGNRLTNLVTSGVTPVAPGGFITYVYDGADWLLVGHNQGAWITQAFSAGDFTGNGAQTWTVAAGDIEAQSYCVVAKTITYALNVKTSTVGGTPDFELRATLPNSYTAVGSQLVIVHVAQTATPINNASLGGPVAGAAYVRFFKDFAGGNYTADTDGTYTRGLFTFELT